MSVIAVYAAVRLIGGVGLWNSLYGAFGLRSSTGAPMTEGAVTVHFVNVGQGDCALIRTGTRDILIDCGEYDEYPTVARYLDDAGVTRLDTVIMSHPHSDHMGCMFRIIARYGAGALVMPAVQESMIPVTGSYEKLMRELERQKISVFTAKPGTFIDTGGCGTLEVIAPVREYDDLNNSSVTVRYTYGDVSFLFTGDIESEAENDILASGADIRADVIKVPHHGSGTSSTRAFVQAVKPVYAVFSVKQENDYGHPHANIVELYEALGAEILRTDTDGSVSFSTDGHTITVYRENALAAAA